MLTYLLLNYKCNLQNPSINRGQTIVLGAATTDIDGLTSLVVDDITINGQTISTAPTKILL